jgi:pyrroloquinoline quinone (PQQ) biosynthesis protein C
MTFKTMSKAVNDDLIARRVNASMIAYDMRVNFEIENAVQIYDPKWYQKQLKGEITNAQLRQFAIERWNVVKEIRITLKAIKPFDLEV